MPFGPSGPSGGASIGGTLTGGIAGSVLFVNPNEVTAQDNENFFFDTTLDKLLVNDIALWRGGPGELTSITSLALGVRALQSALAGAVSNTAIGRDALMSLTTGSNNTAVGDQALGSITTAGFCTAVGSAALFTNTGANNTAIGALAMRLNSTGSGNTAIGREALLSNTTGVDNVAVGHAALINNLSGNSNTGLGHDALRNNNANNNTAIGLETLLSSNTGINNTAVGMTAMRDKTSGSNNTAVGSNTGRGITTGSGNTIIGANVIGLAAGLTNNIIIADGNGTIRLQIDAAGNFRWTTPLIALGGGAAPTLGTIGGAGPATAAQNTWLQFLDSTGAVAFMPVWK